MIEICRYPCGVGVTDITFTNGYCYLFERALELGIPALTVVKASWLPHWLDYGGNLIKTLESYSASIMTWCQSVLLSTPVSCK